MINTLISIKDSRLQFSSLLDNLDISENTKKDYLFRINPFTAFVKKYGLNNNTYLEYKRSLGLRSDLSVSTKNKLLIVAKILLRELVRQGLIPDITSNTKLFSEVRKHKKDGFSFEEIVTIGEYLRQLSNTKEHSRVKAIISLLTYQGLRICEITRLQYSDIDFITKTALIKGKGMDDKEKIYLNPKTVESIQNYMIMNKISDGWLFPCNSNNNIGKPLTTRSIQVIVTNILKQLSVNKTCHSFRHFFVTELIKVYKSDLSRVMSYSRHKSLSMLTIYNDTILQKNDLPRFFRAFNTINI